tara:strand:+ start:1242 stop:2150 length:909 start_codon:yes stop_codon:yes gene_type:complete
MESLFLWEVNFLIEKNYEDDFIVNFTMLGINSYAFKNTLDNKKDILEVYLWLSDKYNSSSSKAKLESQLSSVFKAREGFEFCMHWKKFENQDWSEIWKKNWIPDPIGEKILILPEWLDQPIEYKDRTIIRIDPGPAFGTGSHPSTRLCLEHIESGLLKDLRIIDIGSGSGILSIAALKFGAKEVIAFDIDPLAISSSKNNFLLNYPEEIIPEIIHGSIDSYLNYFDKNLFDLAICNILAPTIEALIPFFHKTLGKEGELLLSGVLKGQFYSLSRKLLRYNWHSQIIDQNDEWVLIQAHLKSK